MRNPSLFILLLTACSSSTPAQEPEGTDDAQAAVAHLEAPGLQMDVDTWHGADGSSGPVWRVRVDSAVLTVLPSEGVQSLTAFQQHAAGDAWVLVNGGFYDSFGAAMSLVIHDGEEHRALGSGSGVITGPSPVRILHKDAYTPGPTEALQSIDRVVDGANNLVNTSPGARRAARTVVAVDGDLVWMAVFADQRSVVQTPDGARLVATSAIGPTLHEAAEYVRTELSAKAALNLDGAVSTQFSVHTQTGDFTVHGERDIINAIILTPTQAE